MLLYTNLTTDFLETLEFDVVKKKGKGDKQTIEYLNIECAFDIETSSVITEDGKTSFMYIWMLGLGYGKPVFYGRTWDEFQLTILTITHFFELNENRRLPIYIHNLGYEFQFFRKHFRWVDVFAINERKPVSAVCDYGIEFRDSYVLSGYSLANTAKNLPKEYSHIKKMVGDLDYSLTRTHLTPLTDDEMKYCENDIIVILAYIHNEIKENGSVVKIPMTNTSRVRKFVRSNCLFPKNEDGKRCSAKSKRFKKTMKYLTLEPNHYTQLKRGFMGGFTHSNPNMTNTVIENVDSVDLTSSYPTVMLADKFPMSKGVDIQINSLSHLDKLTEKYCLLFDVCFEGLENTLGYESYISESKCIELKEAVTNNGRVWNAEKLVITLTDVDLNIIKHVYKWERIAFKNVVGFRKGYLPKPIIESILELYEKKTTLKDVEGSETEYMLSKGMLNSVYGMSVTDFVKDNHTYTNEWNVEPVSLDEEIGNYNTDRNRFLFYPWGVWVTAYARRNLWSLILNVGSDYIYADTDSVKMINYKTHVPKIEAYNKHVLKKLIDMMNYYKLDVSRLTPKSIKGVEKPLGIWEFEGHYTKFKTLGAKRYLVEENGHYHITVAGLSKQNGVNYIIEQAGNDSEKVFDLFSHSLYVPSDRTGKMTHTYIDDEIYATITDYKGVKTNVISMSGIHLENCDFTLSISVKYLDFIRKLSIGEIYKGMKNK